MKLTTFHAKLASIDGNPLELAEQLRSIASQLEQSADMNPLLLTAKVLDTDGHCTGVWALKRIA